MANKLKTQADGRAFAIALIGQCEREVGDEGGIEPISDVEGEAQVYLRIGPQWDGLYQALLLLHSKGTEDARKGFASILTDHLALPGSRARDHQDREDEGRAQDFGQRGDAIPLPVGAAKAKLSEARADKRFQRAMTSVVLNRLRPEPKKGAADE